MHIYSCIVCLQCEQHTHRFQISGESNYVSEVNSHVLMFCRSIIAALLPLLHELIMTYTVYYESRGCIFITDTYHSWLQDYIHHLYKIITLLVDTCSTVSFFLHCWGTGFESAVGTCLLTARENLGKPLETIAGCWRSLNFGPHRQNSVFAAVLQHGMLMLLAKIGREKWNLSWNKVYVEWTESCLLKSALHPWTLVQWGMKCL